MNTALLSHFLKQFFPLATLVVVLATFLWSGSMGMPQNTTRQMAGCPSMGVVALCEMSPLEHVAKWQNLFSALPAREAAAFLAVLFVSISALSVWRYLRNADSVSSLLSSVPRNKDAFTFIPSTLREAFSRGILNPKIF